MTPGPLPFPTVAAFALAAKRDELTRRLRDRELLAIEHTPDSVDAVQAIAIREAAASVLTAETALLREIEAALKRIDDGSYGVCEDCEEPISERRLAAIPWTRRCVPCQERAEREAAVEAVRCGCGGVLE